MNEYDRYLKQKAWLEWSRRVSRGSGDRSGIWKEEVALERSGPGRENDMGNSIHV